MPWDFKYTIAKRLTFASQNLQCTWLCVPKNVHKRCKEPTNQLECWMLDIQTDPILPMMLPNHAPCSWHNSIWSRDWKRIYIYCTCHTRHLSHTAGGLAKPPKKIEVAKKTLRTRSHAHANILCNDRCSMVLFASRRSQHCILTGPQHTYMQNVSLHGQPGNIDGVADFTDLFDQSHHVLIVVYMKVPWIAPRCKLHCKVPWIVLSFGRIWYLTTRTDRAWSASAFNEALKIK